MVNKEDIYKCINLVNKILGYIAILFEWIAIFSIFHLYNRSNDHHFALLTSYTLVPISDCSTQKYLMTLKPIAPMLRDNSDITWEDGAGQCDSGVYSNMLTAPVKKIGDIGLTNCFGKCAVEDTGICKEVNITKSFGVEFEKKHFGNSDYLTDYDIRIDLKDRKMNNCSRTKCEPFKYITCRLDKEYYPCKDEMEVGTCLRTSYSDVVDEDPNMDYGEYLKRTVCSNLSHTFVVQKRNTSWEFLEKLHYHQRDYSTKFNDTDYYHVVSRTGAFLAISSPTQHEGDTHCLIKPKYVSGTQWIIAMYVFAKILEALILAIPDMRCLNGYRLVCWVLLKVREDDEDDEADEFDEVENGRAQMVFSFMNTLLLYITCILPANIILPGLIQVSDEHSAVMEGVDNAVAKDPTFVGPGIWHTESSLYTLVWAAGSWHAVFIIILVIAVIGTVPFWPFIQCHKREGYEKYAMASTFLSFLPLFLFYTIFTCAIFFDPMYKITFAIAFPVEFSFEYGFPVPGLATRVAICAISSAFLKYLVLVLRILNATFGMSIKLSA